MAGNKSGGSPALSGLDEQKPTGATIAIALVPALEAESSTIVQEMQSLEVKPKLPTAEKAPATKPYWLGTLAGCPFQNVACAGQEFPRFTEDVKVNPDTIETKRTERPGVVVYLTDARVKAILDAVASKVVRMGGGRQELLGIQNQHYTRDGSDEPLGKFLYMVPLNPLMPANWQGMSPTPMVR